MLRQAIIADDLTGACDAAAPWAARGLRTRALLEAPSVVDPNDDVLALATHSRDLDPSAAVRSVGDALAVLSAFGPCRVWKKIDSTLLGGFVWEADAAARWAQARVAVVAPAFPAMGRTYVDGELHREGVATGRRIADCVRQQLGQPCRLVPLATVRQGAAAVRAAIDALRHGDREWCAVDAAMEGDLDVVCEALEDFSADVLPVASGGLLRAAAARVPRRHDAALLRAARTGGRGLLVVYGSVQPRTQTQIAQLLADPATRTVDLQALAPGVAADYFREGCIVATRVAWTSGETAALGGMLAEAARSGVAGVLATGGDTARRLCQAAGCTRLDLLGEVAPGLPLGLFGDGCLAGTPLVTKAGGFGDPAAVVRACGDLRGGVRAVVAAQ